MEADSPKVNPPIASNGQNKDNVLVIGSVMIVELSHLLLPWFWLVLKAFFLNPHIILFIGLFLKLLLSVTCSTVSMKDVRSTFCINNIR